MFEAIITGIISGVITGLIIVIAQFFLTRWLSKLVGLIKAKIPPCSNCGRKGVYDFDLKRGIVSCAFCGYIETKPDEE